MKRLAITLTDEEHGNLERLAVSERRSVREMAAYLVAKGAEPKPLLVKPQTHPFITNTTDATNDLQTVWPQVLRSQTGQNIC